MNIQEIQMLVAQQEPQLVALRRELHQIPELSGKEMRTSQTVEKYLTQYGIEYQTGYAGYGIVAIVRGGAEGKTIGIRADMDALPIQETLDIPFRSQNDGAMHACGHDAHTAMMLTTAILFQQHRDELKGNVKFFFQPAEEAIGGAEPMIAQGCLENPHTDHVIGLHVMPTVPTGKVEMRYGKLNGSSGSVKITLRGKAGHAAYPDTAIDAIVMAGQTITALQSMVSRNTSPLNSVVLSLGTIHGGEKNNIIAQEVVIGGTLRTLDTPSRNAAKEHITRIVEHTAAAYGGTAEVVFKDGYIALINDDFVTKQVEETAKALVGEDNIIYKEFPSMGGEDFSYFTDAVPSAFFHLGCRNEAIGCDKPLHNDGFQLDEDCLKLGVAMEMATVLRLLGQGGEV